MTGAPTKTQIERNIENAQVLIDNMTIRCGALQVLWTMRAIGGGDANAMLSAITTGCRKVDGSDPNADEHRHLHQILRDLLLLQRSLQVLEGVPDMIPSKDKKKRPAHVEAERPETIAADDDGVVLSEVHDA